MLREWAPEFAFDMSVADVKIRQDAVVHESGELGCFG